MVKAGAFLDGLCLFGDSSDSYDESNETLTILKIKPGFYESYASMPGVTTIGKSAGKRCTIKKLMVGGSVATIQAGALKTCGLTEVYFEDSNTPLKLERGALGLQNVKSIVCPDRLHMFGEQYYGFTQEILADSEFVSGLSLTDFDFRILGHFEVVDLRKMCLTTPSFYNLWYFFEKETDVSQVSKTLLLPVNLFSLLSEEVKNMLNEAKRLAVKCYGEGNINYNF